MDVIKGKGNKGNNLIIKTWERCKSFGRDSKRKSRLVRSLTPRSKSCNQTNISLEDDEKCPRRRRVAPEGCFPVYVGPQKQRFVIKTEHANHPLFKILLEEAESEYGYNSEGPLTLPCDAHVFYEVFLAAVDDNRIDDKIHPGCGFVKNYGYQILSPSRMIAMNQ